MLLISSLVLVIVALIKERFLERLNGAVIVGLFNVCWQGSCSFNYASWFSKTTETRWYAFQTFLLLETLVKVPALLMMKYRPAWEIKWANRKKILHGVLIAHMITSIISGAIALGTGVSVVTSPVSDYQSGYYSVGVSMILLIVAYPCSVVSYACYALAWRVEVESPLTGSSQSLLFGNVDSQQQIQLQPQIQLHPQQVSLNVNGQMIMATLAPSTPVLTNQPVIQPIYQPVNQPIYPMVHQPINQQMIQPTQHINQPVMYMPNPAVQGQQMIYSSYPQGQGPLVVMNGQPMAVPQFYQSNNQPINQQFSSPVSDQTSSEQTGSGEFVSGM